MSNPVLCNQADENQALAANDVRVLVSQLNEAIQRAAANRLRVAIDVSAYVDVKGPATCYPVVAARLFAEIE